MAFFVATKAYPEYANWQIDGAQIFEAMVPVLDRTRAGWTSEYCSHCLTPDNARKTQADVVAQIKTPEEWGAWYWMGSSETYVMEKYLMLGPAGTSPVPPGGLENEQHKVFREVFGNKHT